MNALLILTVVLALAQRYGRGRWRLPVPRDHVPRLVRLLPEPRFTVPALPGSWPRAPRPTLLRHDGVHCRDCGRTVQACAVTRGLNRDDPQRCEYIMMRRALGELP